MKLTRKQTLIGAAVAIAIAGGSYGAYTYISGLPKRLSKEEAAKRYLEIVCPGNALNPELIAVSEEGKARAEEMERIRGRLYYDHEMRAAQKLYNSLGEKNKKLYERYRSLIAQKRDLDRKAADELLDTEYVWPDDVKEDIVKGAEVTLERAAAATSAIDNKTGVGATGGDEVFTTIRRKLGLDERGTGCPEVKKTASQVNK